MTTKISRIDLLLVNPAARSQIYQSLGSFVELENQPKVKKALGNLLQVPFKFESYGSQIIFNEPSF